MTLCLDSLMPSFLNIHAHRSSVSPCETVVRNFILPLATQALRLELPCGWFSAGIHPWHLPEVPEESLRQLDVFTHSPRCLAIGEVGLDKCRDASFALQREIFMRQLELASDRRLPVIIHCVKAWSELWAVVKEIRPATACVIHGFRGKPQLAESLLAQGFYLSFGRCYNADSLRLCPPGRLFLETDEAPHSVETVYCAAASLRGCTPEELNTQCWENLRQIMRMSGNRTVPVPLKET